MYPIYLFVTTICDYVTPLCYYLPPLGSLIKKGRAHLLQQYGDLLVTLLVGIVQGRLVVLVLLGQVRHRHQQGPDHLDVTLPSSSIQHHRKPLLSSQE